MNPYTRITSARPHEENCLMYSLPPKTSLFANGKSSGLTGRYYNTNRSRIFGSKPIRDRRFINWFDSISKLSKYLITYYGTEMYEIKCLEKYREIVCYIYIVQTLRLYWFYLILNWVFYQNIVCISLNLHR